MFVFSIDSRVRDPSYQCYTNAQVDPFGLDKVDIPMEAFCRTIEQQLHAIDERNSMGTMDMLASKKDT